MIPDYGSSPASASPTVTNTRTVVLPNTTNNPQIINLAPPMGHRDIAVIVQ